MMKPFDIYIHYMPWGTGGKFRPVLVFALDSESVRIYSITSRFETKSKAMQAQYFKIIDWRQAGLTKQSYVDTVSLIKLPRASFEVKPPVGKLTEQDKRGFLVFLNSL